MTELTPLTSKSGESEWPYKGKTIISVIDNGFCEKCIFDSPPECLRNKSGFNIKCTDFDLPAKFTYKSDVK